MSNNKKTFFSKVLILSMLSMIIISTFIVTVSASSVDSAFNYTLNGQDNYKTSHREKQNNSCVYMYCKTITGPTNTYTTKIYGGPRNAGTFDCSWGYTYRFYKGYQRFMYNSVYEKGYALAAVYANERTSNIVVTGVWSPDSVPQSGVLPPTDHS